MSLTLIPSRPPPPHTIVYASSPDEQATKMGFIPGAAYLQLPRAEEPWIVHKLLPVGGLLNLYGTAKAGKSYAALQLAIAVASGQPEWLGLGVDAHGPTAYIQLDTARQTWLAEYLDHATLMDGYDVTNVGFADAYAVPYPFNLLGEGGTWLKKAIAEMTPKPILVILDTLRDAHAGDENDSGVMRNVVTTFRDALDGAAGVLVSHARKLQKDQTVDLLGDNRGSNYVAGASDGILRMWANPKGTEGTITCQSRSLPQQMTPIRRLPSGFWHIDTDDAVLQQIRLVMREHPDATGTDQNKLIAARTGKSTSQVWRVRNDLDL